MSKENRGRKWFDLPFEQRVAIRALREARKKSINQLVWEHLVEQDRLTPKELARLVRGEAGPTIPKEAGAGPTIQSVASPRKRGRRSKFTEEQLRQALAAKKAVKNNSQIATILYRVNTPTDGQKRCVSTILKHHSAKLDSPSKK